jgi:hypothetical protein
MKMLSNDGTGPAATAPFAERRFVVPMAPAHGVTERFAGVGVCGASGVGFDFS